MLQSIKKEVLLLIRDLGALIILFAMPLLLVVTVTLLQDGAFKTISEQQTKVLIVDNDGGEIAQHIGKGLAANGSFIPISVLNGKPITEAIAREEVLAGNYLLAIVIPEKLSDDLQAEVANNVTFIINAFAGETTATPTANIPTKEVRLYFDPTLPLSFKEMVKTHIDKMMYQVENQFIYTAFEKELGEGKQLPFPTGKSLVTFTEINPTSIGQIPNSVQHNVPAWTLFAIFFITIPLSTNIVKERTQGTYIRLSTSPLSYGELLLAKVFVFLCISLLQFSLMLTIGMYIFPYLGLPPLEIGENIKVLSLIALGAGLAAIGIGVLLGTLCRTQEQSAPLGATLTVILAAIGGIWIPIFVMPPFMQTIAKLSPMNWALQAFYEVLLR